jgi:hypothetical protein
MSAYPDGFTFQEYDRARVVAQRSVAVHAIREQRVARVIAGGVGIVGAVVTAASLVDLTPWSPPLVLMASAAAPLATYLAVRNAMRFSSARGSVDLEGWSLGLPLVATVVLAPLSLHAVVAALIGAAGPESFATQLSGFTGWMRISGAIVGHAHLALAVLAARFVRRLRRRSHAELATSAGRAGVNDVLMTAAIAAVPGIVLLAIPPVLVAVTGIAFVPFAYEGARRVLLRERELLARHAAAANRTPDIAELEAARAELLEAA